MTNPIPDEIMERARDLAHTGCGCDEVEAQTCEHVRECLCERPATAIALAILAERLRCAAIARSDIQAPRIWKDGAWFSVAGNHIADRSSRGEQP